MAELLRNLARLQNLDTNLFETPETTSIGRRYGSWSHGKGRTPKHDAGFNFQPLSIPFVGPELPLFQGIADCFFLFRKCAQKVNVLDLALFINDQAHGDCVISALRKHGVNPLNYVFPTGIVLDAHRNIPASASGRGSL